MVTLPTHLSVSSLGGKRRKKREVEKMFENANAIKGKLKEDQIENVVQTCNQIDIKDRNYKLLRQNFDEAVLRETITFNKGRSNRNKASKKEYKIL